MLSVERVLLLCSVLVMLRVEMKFIALYRPDSEHATSVETFLHDFQPQIPPEIKQETISLNTREGAVMATLYDIVQYPAIVITTDDGVPLKIWSGPMMPIMNEVSSYFYG